VYNEERKKLANVSFEEYLWTHAVTLNRSHIVNDELVLSPVLDFLNHSFEPNCQLVPGTNGIALKAVKSIEEGE
jgi:hypothetical protein